jgi:hypothetical protein
VVIGVRADGRKELLAIEEGYRESRESWAQVLRSLRDLGSAAPWRREGRKAAIMLVFHTNGQAGPCDYRPGS